jgi:GntR family transcriptional regulator
MSDPEIVVRSKPIADQAANILRERISQGVYSLDQRMPSETQLSEELHISRSSLRTAMASLAAEGYVRRLHGDGTYACPRNFHLTLHSGKTWDIERQILQSGRQPSLRLLEMGPRPAFLEEAKRLAIKEGEPIFVIRRLVLASGQTVGLIENRIIGEGLAAGVPDSAGQLPPQEFLELYHKRKPREGEMRFSASLADEGIAAALGIRSGEALLCMDGNYFDAQRRPLFYVHEVYRGEEGFELQTGFVQS